MPLPFRPVPLLLSAALMAAGGVAAAAPQQQRHPRHPQAAMQDEDAPRATQSSTPALSRPDWAPRTRSEDALSDSVRRVEQRTRSQVLSAERVPYDGRNLNRIKVVDERGRVRVYMDDPQAQPRTSRQSQQDSGAAEAPTRDNDD